MFVRKVEMLGGPLHALFSAPSSLTESGRPLVVVDGMSLCKIVIIQLTRSAIFLCDSKELRRSQGSTTLRTMSQSELAGP